METNLLKYMAFICELPKKIRPKIPAHRLHNENVKRGQGLFFLFLLPEVTAFTFLPSS